MKFTGFLVRSVLFFLELLTYFNFKIFFLQLFTHTLISRVLMFQEKYELFYQEIKK